MSFDTIHTISFDATGTLFDAVPSIGGIYSEILQEHGVSISEDELEMRFMAEFHKSRTIPLEFVDEEHERERWRSVIQNILREEFSESIFEALWVTMGKGFRWKTKPRLFRTLDALKEAGFRLVVISNWDQRLHGILAALKLTPYFDRVFISTELGSEKPSEEVYRKVAAILDADPCTLLHIGNSPSNDYRPALRSDWNALLLHNRIPYGMEPGTVLGSIDQLPEVLKSEQSVH
jgi:putative hydrolase of the HAD superfamily